MTHIEQEFQEIENNNGWQMTYRRLANEHGVRTLEKKCNDAILSYNRPLNRYRDVLPYDDTRVRLTDGHNDYINANLIEVPWANRKYILTQGPLRVTSNHFWQMVWEQNTRVIVMLTRLIEKGSDKCWLYYPDYENDSELTYDDVNLKVAFISSKDCGHYTERQFELIHLLKGETRHIIHWSDFEWPDHGAPSAPEPFLNLLCDVRYCGAFDPRFGPPVLHCSAGIGRSGTFVLVDSVLKMLATTTDPEEVSLTDVLGHIRTQRINLVQTYEQLRFSYMAIIAGMKVLDKIEDSEEAFRENVSSGSNSNFEDSEIDEDREDNDRLLESLDSIKFQLEKRKNDPQNGSTFSENSKSADRDGDTTLRLRQERLKRNETIQKKVEQIKANMKDPKSSSALTTGDDSISSRVRSFINNYRQPLIIGLAAILAGSFFLYEFLPKNK